MLQIMKNLATVIVLTFATASPAFSQVDMQKYLNRAELLPPDYDAQSIINRIITPIDQTPWDPENPGSPGDPWNPPLEPSIRIIFPVYTDGYLISGLAYGTVEQGYTPAATPIAVALGQLANKEPLFPIEPFDNGYKLVSTGSIRSDYKFQFTTTTTNTSLASALHNQPVVFYRLVYHRGSNSTTTWKTGIMINNLQNIILGHPAGMVIDSYGPASSIEGGNYYRNDLGPYSTKDILNGGLRGATQLTEKTYISNPIIGRGKSKLEKVELYLAKPTGRTQVSESVVFSQFYSSLPSNSNVYISLPGIGLLKHNRDFLPETVTFQNISVAKHTKTTYRTSYIYPIELDQEFDGDIDLFQTMMTNVYSVYLNPWPVRSAIYPQIVDLGGSSYFKTNIQ